MRLFWTLLLNLLVLCVCSACNFSLGKAETPPLAGSVSLQDSSGPLFPVWMKGLEGRINAKGQLVIPAQFVQIRPFSEGLASVEVVLEQDQKQEIRDGVIDRQGKLVIPLQFRYVDTFVDGYAYVEQIDPKTGKQWADFINPHGKLSFNNPKITRANTPGEGLFPIEFETASGPRWGYVDKAGVIVISPEYGYANPFKNGVAFVLNYREGGPFAAENEGALITHEGKILIDHQPSFGNYEFSEGLVSVRVKGKWGCMDKTGHLVIPPQFEWVGRFSQGLATAQLNGKWGFINKTGQWAITPQYTNAFPFSEGRAAVNTSVFPEAYRAAYGYVDLNGKMIIPAQYEEVQAFSEGLAPVSVKHQWGFINPDGKFILPAKFLHVEPFKNGLARFADRPGPLSIKHYGYIDKAGKVVWKPTR